VVGSSKPVILRATVASFGPNVILRATVASFGPNVILRATVASFGPKDLVVPTLHDRRPNRAFRVTAGAGP
jgi:hypothetical protein